LCSASWEIRDGKKESTAANYKIFGLTSGGLTITDKEQCAMLLSIGGAA